MGLGPEPQAQAFTAVGMSCQRPFCRRPEGCSTLEQEAAWAAGDAVGLPPHPPPVAPVPATADVPFPAPLSPVAFLKIQLKCSPL